MRKTTWSAGVAVWLALLILGCNMDRRAPTRADVRDDRDRIVEAFRNRESGLMVEAHGEVTRVLSDDTRPPRHQRFIVELVGGHTVLIAHNIDLAPRVPLDRGASVAFRGEYEWNERGGVIHWTHHDPDGRRAGGWIEVGDSRYR